MPRLDVDCPEIATAAGMSREGVLFRAAISARRARTMVRRQEFGGTVFPATGDVACFQSSESSMEGQMESRRVSHSASRILCTGAVVVLTTAMWAANTTKLIYSFTGNAGGEYTDTELVRDSAGNLFGTSVQGGTFGGGTVFKVTPAGVHTVLYNFTGGTDGGEPYKGVTLDADGNLVGTAVTGGGGSCEGGCGVVFELTNSGGVWTQTVIHSFTGSDGSGPGSPVAVDGHGNLYGTTPTGGAFGMGVVYRLSPNGTGGWNFHVIHTFTGGADGGGGSAGSLLIGSAGNLYGVCTVGGVNGFGTVYEMAFVQGK